MPENNKTKSILVVFGETLPRKQKSWFEQFDEVLGPKELERFIAVGSIQEANRLVNELPDLILADGRKISKSVNWRGYDLWWMHYNDLMYEFCLPYIQYRGLLLYLKNFNKVYLYQAPWPALFQYFLKVHNCQCIIVRRFQLKNLLPIPFGIFIQIILSVGFLICLKITRSELMVWTADRFDHPHDYDFRMKFIYEELRRRKVSIVEFVRSLEPWQTVLRHAWRRKRPVVYSTAIIEILHYFTRRFSRFSISFSAPDPEQRFWFLVAAHYLSNLRGTIWSIRVMKFILQWIGVKAAIITAGCNRTFHEVLGCKLAGIKTVGIQHAAITRHAFIADFMPGFDNKITLSVDRYGLWSNWWRDYYLKYSRAYKPEQLCVSGPLRSLDKEALPKEVVQSKQESLTVLFVSEQLAAPSEVFPFLLKLLDERDLTLYLKCRPYRDGFEEWLKKNRPDILEKVMIFRNTQEAISKSDVVVGSHSSVVLEGLLQLKPIVFFWTNKWGDYFDIKSLDEQGWFFAENPEELVSYVRKSGNMPKHILKQLQERFFANPYQNGSEWVVEQALEFAKTHGRA